jgi:hypothetical protein
MSHPAPPHPAPPPTGAPGGAAVRDPNWIATRLRHACSDAAKVSKIYMTHFRPPGPRAVYELGALHNAIRHVVDDLTKWGPAGDAFVERLNRMDLPALIWQPLAVGVGFRGCPDPGMPADDAFRAAEQWACRLALTEEPGSARFRRTRRWTGGVEGWLVEVRVAIDAFPDAKASAGRPL